MQTSRPHRCHRRVYSLLFEKQNILYASHTICITSEVQRHPCSKVTKVTHSVPSYPAAIEVKLLVSLRGATLALRSQPGLVTFVLLQLTQKSACDVRKPNCPWAWEVSFFSSSSSASTSATRVLNFVMKASKDVFAGQSDFPRPSSGNLDIPHACSLFSIWRRCRYHESVSCLSAYLPLGAWRAASLSPTVAVSRC